MKTKILAVLMVLVMVASVFTVAAGDSSSSGLDTKTAERGGGCRKLHACLIE
ncbi:hypothetical protein [Candidatus Methanomassiliicoccus intestinalis]|uniref:hypothetical protein n=1 Tax=Candidatus Methanomassiliicoccus intestinalis TaxID=1406512 RepID=UPI0037DC3AC6